MNTMNAVRHYYAIDWSYGIGSYMQDDPLPCGGLHVFDTQAGRDRWVADDPDHMHRAETDAATATRMMRRHVAGITGRRPPVDAARLVALYRNLM